MTDFANPGPSVKKFFDTYGDIMKKFKTQLVVFYVGSGDHIYSYPPNAFSSTNPSIKPIITNNLPVFDNSSATLFAQTSSADSFDGIPGIKVTIPNLPDQQLTVKSLYPDGQGISVHSFPVIRWNWKKAGGTTIVFQIRVRNVRTGEKHWIGYYAGARLPEYTNTNYAQFYLGPLPSQWTSVSINLKQDLDVWSLKPNAHEFEKDDWEVIGLALSPMDGSSGWYNNIRAESSVGINWDRFCGNAPCMPTASSPNMPLEQFGRDYPQELTYAELKNVFKTYKDEAAARGFTNFKILDGIEAGMEFSGQEWKFYRHPEVVKIDPILNGKRVLSFQASLIGDTYPYAYPDYRNGIPQGTIVYDFVANQIGQYVNDMKIDGIYSTNDFGVQNQWHPFGDNLDCTPSINMAHPCQGFVQADADQFLTFLKNIKQKIGPNKYHIWMDTYYSVDVNHDYFSIPESAYDYVDYIQSSTFFQDGTRKPIMPGWIWPEGKPFPGGPSKGKTYTIFDTVQSEIDLKQRHPNLKLLWTFYYNDPWYHKGGYQAAIDFKYWDQYKSNLDGAMVYANSYKGELMPISWLTLMANTIPLPTALPTKPVKIAGDANLDGKVDLADYSIWKSEYLGQAVTKNADFNYDGVVDLADYTAWKKGYLGM